MKFVHLSDLHLGKRVNQFSMIEDQYYILNQILSVIDAESPDAVLIAGDVYDKSVPSAEAVTMFDDFLVQLSQRNLQVFIISGNHDSAERLAFGNRLLDANGIHISPVYDGTVTPITLQDAYGAVDVYLLPFLKPVVVRSIFPDKTIETYDDAVRAAVEHITIDDSRRNVMVAHQFVTGAQLSESEEIFVGGSENIDGSVFSAFDYTALGHIHRSQTVGNDTIRYCGTPLKYSFSEANHKKTVTVVELAQKGDCTAHTVPLVPMRDMVKLRGTYAEVTAKSFYDHTNWQEDYVHITLTDEEDIFDAIGKLRSIYHNLMQIEYDNKRTQYTDEIVLTAASNKKHPMELFTDFYEQQNNQPMQEEQQRYMEELIENIWRDAE